MKQGGFISFCFLEVILSCNFIYKPEKSKVILMEEKNIESLVKYTVEKILDAHSLRGARAFDIFSKEAFNSIPRENKLSAELYEKILSGVEKYVSENFDKSSVTRCMAGDLLREGHPQKILDYVENYVMINNEGQAA